MYLLLILVIVIIIFFYSIRLSKINEIKKLIKKLKSERKKSDIFNNIPKYYINLDRSSKRRENIEKNIEKYQIKNIYRIKAFDGKNIKDKRKGVIDGFEYVNNYQGRLYYTNYELAITMSHLLAIRKAKENNYKNIIIMEDDIEFFLLPQWNEEKLNSIIENLSEDCDILLLAHSGSAKDFSLKKYSIKKTRVSGVCYLVTQRGMKKFEKFFKHKQFTFNTDNIIWDTEILQKMNIYHTDKSLFLLYNFKFLSERNNYENNLQIDHDSYKVLKSYT